MPDLMGMPRLRDVVMRARDVVRSVRLIARQRRLSNDDRGENEYASAHECSTRLEMPVRPMA